MAKTAVLLILFLVFFTSPAVGKSDAVNRLLSEYLRYATAEQHPSGRFTREDAVLFLQLSEISDLDKYKILNSSIGTTVDLFNTIVEKRDTDLCPPRVNNTQKQTVNLFSNSEHYTKRRLFQNSCILSVLRISHSAKITFDAGCNTSIYGGNYFTVIRNNSTLSSVEIYIDREGLNLQTPENVIGKLGGRLSNAEILHSEENPDITVYRFKSADGFDYTAEFLSDYKLCFIRLSEILG